MGSLQRAPECNNTLVIPSTWYLEADHFRQPISEQDPVKMKGMLNFLMLCIQVTYTSVHYIDIPSFKELTVSHAVVFHKALLRADALKRFMFINFSGCIRSRISTAYPPWLLSHFSLTISL